MTTDARMSDGDSPEKADRTPPDVSPPSEPSGADARADTDGRASAGTGARHAIVPGADVGARPDADTDDGQSPRVPGEAIAPSPIASTLELPAVDFITRTTTRVLIPAAGESTLTQPDRKRDLTVGDVSRHLQRFGWPLVAGMLMLAAFNLVDIFVISTLPNPGPWLTVVGLCDGIMTLWVVVVNGLGNAVIAFIARNVGSGDREAARHAATQSMILIVVLSAIITALGAGFTRPILEAFGTPEGVVLEQGTKYLRIAFFSGTGMFLVVQMTSILRGVGNSTWPATIMVVITVLNMGLAVLFVRPDLFGIEFWPDGDFGGYGVVGGAWATFAARATGLGLALFVFIFGMGRKWVFWNPRRWKPDWPVLRRLLVVGLPSSAQLVIRVGAVLVIYRIIFRNFDNAETVIAPAFTIASKLDLVVLFAAMGWGQAASTMVGQLLGANKPARAALATYLATRYATIMLIGVGVAFYFLAPALIELFLGGQAHGAARTAIVAEGTSYLRAMAFAYPLVGIGIVISQAFTGAGETRVPVVIDFVGLFGIQVGMVLVAIHGFDAGTRTVWIVMASAFLWIALAYVWAFRHGWWRRSLT